MDAELSRFARATKARHLETPADYEQLKRKMLVSQLNKMNNVFCWVSNDLESIENRAPGALKTFRMQPHLMELACKTAVIDEKLAQNQSVFEDFKERIPCPKGHELFAFMAALSKNTDARIHLYNMVHDDPQERRKLVEAIETYVPDHPKTIEQVGKLIKALEWPDADEILDLSEPIKPPEQQEEEEEEEEGGEEGIQLPIAEPLENKENEWRAREDTKAFKIQNDIGGFFSTRKIVVQRVLNYCQLPVGSELMGKAQTTVKDDHWDTEYLNVVDYLPEQVIETLVKLPEVKAHYVGLLTKPEESRALIKSYLTRADKTRRGYTYEPVSAQFAQELTKWALL